MVTTNTNIKIINKIAIIVVVICLMIISFIFGKNQINRTDRQAISDNSEQIKEYQDSLALISKEASSLDDLGLYIPPSKEEKECPDSYPIKIKIDDNNPRYYTENNKSYKKVSAHMCGKNETMVKLLNVFKEI